MRKLRDEGKEKVVADIWMVVQDCRGEDRVMLEDGSQGVAAVVEIDSTRDACCHARKAQVPHHLLVCVGLMLLTQRRFHFERGREERSREGGREGGRGVCVSWSAGEEGEIMKLCREQRIKN